MRSRLPDPGWRDLARQADLGDLGGGADRDRRRRVPARAPSGPGRRGLSHGRARVRRSASTSGRSPGGPSSCACSDGAELGSAVHEYPHGVIERELPATGERLPADWALQDPEDWLEVLREAVPGRRGGRRRRRPSRRHRHRDRLHRLDAAAGRSPTARRCARSTSSASARTRTPSSGSTTPRRSRPTASTRSRAERGEPWLAALRRPDLVGVAVRQGAAGPRGGPRGLRAHGPLRRGRRLDRLAAVRASRRATPARPATRASSRTAATRPRTTCARSTSASRTSSPTSSSGPPLAPLGARAGGLTAAGRRRGPACPRGSRSRSATSTPTSPRPAAQAIEARPDARGHGHLDVPHHERRRASPRSRACAAWSHGGIVPGPVGLRGRPERRRRHLRLVRRQRRPAALPRRGGRARGSTSTPTSPSWPASRRSARTGSIALDWNNGNRSVLVDHELSGLIVGLTLATRAEDVYRALIEATAFGTRTIIETFEAAGIAGARADRRRRPAEEPGDHADLRRRHAARRCT